MERAARGIARKSRSALEFRTVRGPFLLICFLLVLLEISISTASSIQMGSGSPSARTTAFETAQAATWGVAIVRVDAKDNIAVRDLTLQERSDVAIVRFLADESETVFGQRLATKYRVTDTVRRSGTAWKMIASHVSVVTVDPPPQKVAADGWSGLAGTYQLKPDGWTLHVELRDGVLYGGRDAAKLRRFIPLTPTSFVLQGSLGEWLFVVERDGKASRIVDFRKFEPLVWTRIE